MKNTITLIFLCLGTFIYAQSTLTVFNNGGQKFFVILNGVKQNSVAQTNVAVSGIKNGSYSVKVVFADGKTNDIDKNFFLDEASYITTRVVFKKGKGKLQLMGMEPATNQKPDGSVVVYRPTDAAVYSDVVVVPTTTTTVITPPQGTVQTQVTKPAEPVNTNEQINMNVGTNVNGTQLGTTVSGSQIGTTTTTTTNVQVTETQTTQTTTMGNPEMQGENFGINMNINIQDPTLSGQGGANVSINMSGTGTGTQTKEETFNQTTTITTSGTTSGTPSTMSQSGNVAINASGTPTPQTTTTNTNTNIVACKKVLVNEQAMVEDLNAMMHDSDKMESVTLDLANQCLTAAQAYSLVEVFMHESDRLDLAKFLYDRMLDKDNGRNLLPLFTFDSTKVEFKEYMRIK